MQVIDVGAKYYNLIPSRFPPVPVFLRIASDRHDEVADFETRTNLRRRDKERLTGSAEPLPGEPAAVQNWNHAPFVYTNPEGTRFWEPGRPALELSGDLQTAVAVAVAKRELFLSRTAERGTGLDMRVFSRTVTGSFADCRDVDQRADEADRREIGRKALELGVDGVIYRPAERPSAEAVAILHGGVLSRVVQEDHFRFVWDGSRVRVVYAFRDDREIAPSDLGGEPTVLAA